MVKYRKKPVEIEALQWLGDNYKEIKDFCNISFGVNETSGFNLYVHTLEGIMKASIGDYIIKGVQGEFYPCKPDIFKETYDIVFEPDFLDDSF
jgi:hypothetical protein